LQNYSHLCSERYHDGGGNYQEREKYEFVAHGYAHTSMNESSSQSPPPGISEPPAHKRVFHFWRCFWLTFLAVSLAYAWYSFYVPVNSIAWADNYTSAQQQAAESGKPIILYFTGEWCVPCRVMKRQVWADEEVKTSVNAQFIPVAIDVDNPDDAAVLARYNVGGAPVTIITDPQGNALRWRVGGVGKSEFLAFLRASHPSAAKDMQ
jgi:protein disulfide-isomerase